MITRCVAELETADFRLKHLFSEEEIDRSQMTIERSLMLNMELREHDSPFRWLLNTDDPALKLLLG